MRVLSFAARWVLIGLVLFVLGNGIGYLARTEMCRADRQTVFIARPGYHPGEAVPYQLHEVTISRCSLPANWGGYSDRVSFNLNAEESP